MEKYPKRRPKILFKKKKKKKKRVLIALTSINGSFFFSFQDKNVFRKAVSVTKVV